MTYTCSSLLCDYDSACAGCGTGSCGGIISLSQGGSDHAFCYERHVEKSRWTSIVQEGVRFGRSGRRNHSRQDLNARPYIDEQLLCRSKHAQWRLGRVVRDSELHGVVAS